MRPIAVAITGGIGAGKSEALFAFQKAGAATVSSDEIVHHLLRSDPEVREAIVQEFGAGVLADDGSIDRSRVAEVVFADRAKLDFLERLSRFDRVDRRRRPLGEDLLGETQVRRQLAALVDAVVAAVTVDALHRQRQPAALCVDLEDQHLDVLTLRDDLARVLDVMLREL